MTTTTNPPALDHIFLLRRDESWKCCICGAVCKERPSKPTPDNWMPDRYEPLSDEDRDLAKASIDAMRNMNDLCSGGNKPRCKVKSQHRQCIMENGHKGPCKFG